MLLFLKTDFESEACAAELACVGVSNTKCTQRECVIQKTMDPRFLKKIFRKFVHCCLLCSRWQKLSLLLFLTTDRFKRQMQLSVAAQTLASFSSLVQYSPRVDGGGRLGVKVWLRSRSISNKQQQDIVFPSMKQHRNWTNTITSSALHQFYI